MLLRGSAGSSAQPTHPAPTAFKYLPAGVALAVMMLFGHGAVAENAAAPMVGPPEPLSHWAKDYIQHNPYMADGRDSVRAYVVKLGIEHWPKARVILAGEVPALEKKGHQERPDRRGNPRRGRPGVGVLEAVTAVVGAPGDREPVLAALIGRAHMFPGLRRR